MKIKTVKELYSCLEEYDFKDYFNLAGLIDYDLITDSFRECLCLEDYALQRSFGDIPSVLEVEKMVVYYKSRLLQTHNVCLKIKYYLVLFFLDKNNLYAKQAIELLYSQLDELLSIGFDKYSHELDFLLYSLLPLAENIKYHLVEISGLLRRSLNEDKIGPIGDIQIIRFLVDECKQIGRDFDFLPNRCLTLVCKLNDSWRENIINLGIKLAERYSDDLIRRQLLSLKAEHELSQIFDINSNPNNIALPHMNILHLESAMRCYSETKEYEKYSAVEKMYNENKNRLRFISIRIDSKRDVEMSQYFQNFSLFLQKTDFSYMMNELITLEHFFPLSSDLLENILTSQGYSYREIFEPVEIDINHNRKKSDYGVVDMRYLYNYLFRKIYPYLLNLLCRLVYNKKLSEKKLQTYLVKNTLWGIVVDEDNGIPYQLYSLVENGIFQYFKCLKRVNRGHNIDVEKCYELETAIDVLSLKFESLIRFIVKYKGGNVIKINRNSVKEKTLEELLKDDVLTTCFSNTDLLLFRYVFSEKGINLRNNVAHGFMKPYTYDLRKATLLFFAIMRLGKLNKDLQS